MTSIYGFETSDDVQYDKQGLPVGTYKVRIADEEVGETKKQSNPNPLILTFEVLEGEFKGKTGKVWYNVNNLDAKTANIAKQNLKRIGDATGKPVSSLTPLKNRVFTAQVRTQEENENFTYIAKYLPETHKSDDTPF